MKPKYYYDECWRMNFWFFLGWKPSDTEKYLKKHWQFDSLNWDRDAKTIHFDDEKGKQCIAIWLKDKKNIPALAHECVHAVHMCLDSRGVKPMFDNDEIEAYLTETLMRKATQ